MKSFLQSSFLSGFDPDLSGHCDLSRGGLLYRYPVLDNRALLTVTIHCNCMGDRHTDIWMSQWISSILMPAQC